MGDMTMEALDISSHGNEVRGSFESPDVIVEEIGSTLLAPLARSDQRQKGMTYLRGLLGTRGRKSIRNIAAHVGGATAEQSLHHFISDSTWNWIPLRQALTRYLAQVAPPQVWVVQPMVIPKAGEFSVGVDRQYFPALGQVLNAQQAIGVWAVAGNYCYPVNWRLHLSANWLADEDRRSRALIPDGIQPETLGECTMHAFSGVVRELGVPARPVVLESPENDVATIRSFSHPTRVPLLVRIGSTFPLRLMDHGSPGGPGGILPAHHIMGHVKDQRRPVIWRDQLMHGDGAPDLVASARVRLTGPLAARSQDLLLLGTGRRGRPWPGELWLTNMVQASPSELAWLTCLRKRVDDAVTSVGDRVGVRDYAGRSYSGWHRHITMASAAYAVAMLAG